jgi:poly(A) polymerase
MTDEEHTLYADIACLMDCSSDAIETTINDLLDLAIADGVSDRDESREQVEARINELRERIQEVQTRAAQQPLESPLNGNELMELFGRGPGSWLKPLKQHLSDLIIEGVLQPDDKEGAVAVVESFMTRSDTL